MTAASLLGFGVVFLLVCGATSALLGASMAAGRRALARRGAAVERGAAELVAWLPLLLAGAVVAILAVDSAIGPDHCTSHAHHAHLCLWHGAAWAHNGWVIASLGAGSAAVAIRGAWLAAALRRGASVVSRLRGVGRREEGGVELVDSDRVFCFVVGIRRGAIVASSAARAGLSSEEWRAMIAHEASHLHHRDLARRLWLDLALMFAAPRVAIAVRDRWDAATERLRDADAAEAVGDAEPVARALVRMARGSIELGLPGIAAFTPRARALAIRVEALLDEAPRGEGAARWLAGSIGAACALALLGAGAFAGPLHHALETLLGGSARSAGKAHVHRYLLSTVVVCAAARARAEAPGPTTPVIDESQLLARVAQADPRLLRITAEVEAARADVVAAGVRPNPSVALEREEVFPSGGLSTSYLRLELPLEISGRRARRVEAARAATDAAAIEGEGARFAIAIEALRAFRTAAYERLRVELLRAEREALVKAVEVVQKRTRAGTTAGYDLQRIELELAVYDDLIAAAEARLATVRLGALAGAPAGLDAADPLELPGDPPALEELLREAIERRPEYRAAGARLAGARSLRGAASRARVPELTLSGGLVRQDVAADTTAFGYTAGLLLSLPLFDHGQAERARATALLRAAEAEREVVAREVPARVRAWHQILARTIARGRTARQAQLGRLDQLLRSAEAAYREGGGNVVELLDAYGAARDTRLRDLELRRDARLAELDLWLALGRRP